MSEHKKLLSCWHKLEHFSPASTPKASEKNVELLPEKTTEFLSPIANESY